MKLLRWVKRQVLSSDTRFRRVQFGVASGMQLPMNRQNNLRMELGLFEWQLSPFVRKFTRGAKVAYEVGSAEGYYVLAFCRLLGSSGRVVAFEAQEDEIAALKGTLARNGMSERVTIVKGFVGEKEGPGFVTIDGVARQRDVLPPDIVKIDVEGAELKVLQGMEDTLAKASPKLLIEVHALELETECIRFLEARGYEARVVDVGLLGRLFPESRPGANGVHNRWVAAQRKTR